MQRVTVRSPPAHREDPAVDVRVQRLHAAVEDLRGPRVLRHVLHLRRRASASESTSTLHSGERASLMRSGKHWETLSGFKFRTTDLRLVNYVLRFLRLRVECLQTAS